MLKDLAIKDIRVDGGTQQRPVEDDVLSRYVALIKDGVEFPPVDVINDGKDDWMWNGFHRWHAYRKLGKKYIPANVESGTKRDAIWLSFHANHDHGLPRQPGTAKKIILKILDDKEWAKISFGEIARWVGVTESYVRKTRDEKLLAKPEKEDEAHPRTGARIDPETDSKTQEKRSDTLKVKRGDQEYEMKNIAKGVQPLTDSVGEIVPEKLIPVFSRINEIKILIHQLNKLLKVVKEGQARNDPLWSFCKLNPLEVETANVKRNLRFTIPYSVCLYCSGEGKGCRACNEMGFTNEQGYISTAEELKRKNK